MRYTPPMNARGLGIDIGAETLKLAVVADTPEGLRIELTEERAHQKAPARTLEMLLRECQVEDVERIAVTGRLHGLLDAYAVPTKGALRRGIRVMRPEEPELTVLSIGAHGFSVLELGSSGQDWYQQNSRCSQGTGNFLSQLVERFGLRIEEASVLCDNVTEPSALSGRCPVILKTDMTHLANKGEDRAKILAGLFDAVTENVVTLFRPRLAPPRVAFVGGVARSPRIRRRLGAWLNERGMELLPADPLDTFVEAIGAAVTALDEPSALRRSADLASLFKTSGGSSLERVPALTTALSQVRRMPRPEVEPSSTRRRAVLGLDIGSTGSKVVAVDLDRNLAFWETYLNTEGAPVVAAQRLMQRVVEQLVSEAELFGFGVTGSGREVVGSLLRTCYGNERVFVLNEIAAHARGATSLDPDVDTIFEIGGQDAKYIRLEGGRVVDAAMNEACSAGTGSFIAEQGNKFDEEGLHVTELSRRALLADHGISLGQHCSVFMAEVIDDAIAAGEAKDAIIAGLYDSVIQNYLNRVKGARSVGERIFCQGMPFSSDALAAAVARQTGRAVTVPYNPGTTGALGIALLACDEKREALLAEGAVDPARFLSAVVKAKETFICRSTKGCGGSGNKCRIDRLTTLVDGVEQKFLWGGNCSLYDRAATRNKLPDQAPDPFREREALQEQLFALANQKLSDQAPEIAFPDELGFKGMSLLFVTFLTELGWRCRVLRNAGSGTLHRGIEGAEIPYCAPMQLIHGAYFELADQPSEAILLPVFRGLPRVAGEEHGTLCPMVIASADLVEPHLVGQGRRVLRPVIDFGVEGYRSRNLALSLRGLARELGCEERAESALERAIVAQEGFERDCQRLGENALAFCRDHDIVPIAVLGRPYTIYNDVLNSNVPSLLRSLGAIAIPVDCLPIEPGARAYRRQYWSHTQRNLRAAEMVRKTDELYAVFCSNYACGPDSFTLHFFGYLMQNKPFGVIETDGHSGDAGTKTRLEAFLYCVDTDRKSRASVAAPRTDFHAIEDRQWSFPAAKQRGDVILLPRMGAQAELAAAALRADGFQAEALPMTTREDVRLGRKVTSGKECVPMILTLGTLLGRVEREPNPSQTFAFFMPTAKGPCRFGVYNSLHKVVLERQGLAERVRVISPEDTNYFSGTSPDFAARLWTGFLAHDLIQAMRMDVGPMEREPGLAARLYDKYFAEMVRLMDGARSTSTFDTIRQLGSGMWGLRRLVGRAADEFRLAKDQRKKPPTVAVVGEIYVRLDPFANDHLVEKLERRGLRVHFAPFVEWLEYSNYISERRLLTGDKMPEDDPLTTLLTGIVQRVTIGLLWNQCRRVLGWGERPRIGEIVNSGERYVSPALAGEAVLTLGGPMLEFDHGAIDGVVIVGPHECMPCKISEARYVRVAEERGIPYLAVSVSGDAIDSEALDRFAFDLRDRERVRTSLRPSAVRPAATPHSRRISLPVYPSEFSSTGE